MFKKYFPLVIGQKYIFSIDKDFNVLAIYKGNNKTNKIDYIIRDLFQRYENNPIFDKKVDFIRLFQSHLHEIESECDIDEIKYPHSWRQPYYKNPLDIFYLYFTEEEINLIKFYHAPFHTTYIFNIPHNSLISIKEHIKEFSTKYPDVNHDIVQVYLDNLNGSFSFHKNVMTNDVLEKLQKHINKSENSENNKKMKKIEFWTNNYREAVENLKKLGVDNNEI